MHLAQMVGPNLLYTWPMLEHDLRAAPETWDSVDTIESIYNQLRAGDIQFWILVDDNKTIVLGLLTCVLAAAKGKVLRVIWAHGHDPQKAVGAIHTLEDSARAMGCYRVEVSMGRKGWGRLLAVRGYELAFQVVGRDLDVPTKGELN